MPQMVTVIMTTHNGGGVPSDRARGWRISPSGQPSFTPCRVSLGYTPFLSSLFRAPPSSTFLGNSLRKSPAGESLIGDISIQGPLPLPRKPTATATATARRTRCPGPQPPTNQEADPHHHTGFIGPESHRVNLKGALPPHSLKSVRRRRGLAECSLLQSWLSVLVVGLPGLGPLKAPQILESGSAWRV